MDSAILFVIRPDWPRTNQLPWGETSFPALALGSFRVMLFQMAISPSHSVGLHSMYRTLWAVKGQFRLLSNQLDWKSRFLSRTLRFDLIGPEKTLTGHQLHRNVHRSRACALLAQGTSISWGIFPICGDINRMRGGP